MRSVSPLILALALALSAGACASTPKPMLTADVVGQALYTAITARDYDRVRALYPTRKLLASIMSCKDPKVIEMAMYAIRTKRQQVIHSFKSAFKGYTFKWVSSERLKTKTIAKGGVSKGCVFKVPARFSQYKWSFTETKKGQKPKPRTGLVLLWKIADKGWFLFRY